MKFLDVFSGIGGFRLGMEMAGHECVGHIEIDKFAHKSYMAMHNPKETEFYHNDITTITDNHIRLLRGQGIECICGGFPCQAFSIAGKRRGFEDTRGTLFFDLARLARELKPRYLFLENVRGLLSHNGGDTFETILRAMDDIGYDAQWQVLNSKYHGVPQNRERVFIIGYFRGQCTGQVLPIIGDGGKTAELQGQQTANCITARYNGIRTGSYVLEREQYAQEIKQVGNIASKTDNFGGNPQTGRVYDPNGISPALNCMEGGGKEPKIVLPVITPGRVAKRQNERRFKNDNEPMFTLTGQDRHGVAIIGNTNRVVDINNTLIRKLTPRECFRLQGFPDNYFDRAEKVNSDSQLYKQAGNSVTVNVIYEIAKRFK